MQINLPDEPGRLAILRIHTASMVEHKMLADDVSLDGTGYVCVRACVCVLLGGVLGRMECLRVALI